MSVMQEAAERLTNSGGSAEGSGVYLGCGTRTLLITCAHVKWTERDARRLEKLPVKPSGAGEIVDLAIYECTEPRPSSAKVTWEGLLFPWREGAEDRVSVYGYGAVNTCRPKELSLRRSFDGDGLLQLPSHQTFDPGKGDSGAGVWHGDHLIGIFRHRVQDTPGNHTGYGVIPLAWVMALYPELWAEASLLPEKRHDFFFPLRLGQEKQAQRDNETAELHEFPRSVEDPQRLARAMEIHPWDKVLTQKAALSHGAFLLAGEPGGGKTTLSYEAAKESSLPVMELRNPLSAALLKWHTDDRAFAARCVAGVKLWLDGLDELPDSEQTQWLNIASRYKAGQINGVCFITCRTAFVTPAMNEHVTENKPWFLLGLTPQEKPAFLREYAAKRLKGFSEEAVESWVETWQTTLGRSPVLARLSGSPLLLRVLAELYAPSRVQDLHKIEGATLDNIYFQMAEGLLKQRKPDVHVQETYTLLECLYHLAGHEQPISKEWHITISKPVYAKACKTCKVEPALSDVLERSQLIHLNGSRYEWLHLTFLEWAWAAYHAKKTEQEITKLYQQGWHVPRLRNGLTLLWGMLETNVRCRIATWLWQHANIVENQGEKRISCPLRACLHFYGQSGADIGELPELPAFVTDEVRTTEAFRVVVAGDRFTPSMLLEKLARDGEESVRQSVALNPSTPPEVLATLAKYGSEEVRGSVAGNRSTPPELLATLAKDVRSRVAGNRSTPPELLATLAEDESEYVRWSVASNPSTPPELLATLAKYGSEVVRHGVARNRSTPPELLVALSKDESVVRHGVTWNPSTPPELLVALSKDESGVVVREGVARNLSTPPEALATLAKDGSEEVRRCVAWNPSTPPEALETLAKDGSEEVRRCVAWNPSTPPEALATLAEGESVFVRHGVAHNPSAPLSTLSLLSRDKYMLISLSDNPACPLILLLPEGART